MTKFLEHLTSLQGRLTTGCALASAIVLGLWPDHARPVDPAKVAVVIAAAIAWLFAEISGQRPPSSHDKRLFEEIVEVLPQRLLNFLRDQDFGVGSYEDRGTDGLHDVASWQGSRYEFVDPVLNKRWLSTKQGIHEFSRCLALNTWPFHAEKNWRTVHPENGDYEEPTPFVQDRIDRLNEGATKVVDQIHAFETFARRRLGL